MGDHRHPEQPRALGYRVSPDVPTRQHLQAASRAVYITVSEQRLCLIPAEEQLRSQMLKLRRPNSGSGGQRLLSLPHLPTSWSSSGSSRVLPVTLSKITMPLRIYPKDGKGPCSPTNCVLTHAPSTIPPPPALLACGAVQTRLRRLRPFPQHQIFHVQKFWLMKTLSVLVTKGSAKSGHRLSLEGVAASTRAPLPLPGRQIPAHPGILMLAWTRMPVEIFLHENQLGQRKCM